MRRIIEKIVTVVTTTTWKLSWEPDTTESDQPIDPDPADLPLQKHLTSILLNTSPTSSEIERMEFEDEEEDDPLDDELSNAASQNSG